VIWILQSTIVSNYVLQESLDLITQSVQSKTPSRCCTEEWNDLWYVQQRITADLIVVVRRHFQLINQWRTTLISVSRDYPPRICALTLRAGDEIFISKSIEIDRNRSRLPPTIDISPQRLKRDTARFVSPGPVQFGAFEACNPSSQACAAETLPRYALLPA